KTASALLKAGFTEASVLQGGMSAWTSANLPTTK
ncbi:MAG: rhodanese-like domain-containing protein, partial [Glaciecola sp.]